MLLVLITWWGLSNKIHVAAEKYENIYTVFDLQLPHCALGFFQNYWQPFKVVK